MQKSLITHTSKIEVRYAETDAMGIVHHAVYPVWFEQARTEILRINGIPFNELEKLGYGSPVIKLELEYKNPCRYGDFVDVHICVAREDRLRFRFFYKVLVNDKLSVQGSSQHVFTKNGRATPHPPEKFMKIFFPENAEWN